MTSNTQSEIVLAFSGGLDTSFCVPYLIERGYRVTTVFVDTGGVTDDEREYIHNRALSLGADKHITRDLADSLWSQFVVPFLAAGVCYQDQYPLLCSDRYLIVQSMIEIANAMGTRTIAHGCTAMGNDQVRFDQSIRSFGAYDIIAPIREIQALTDTPREYEMSYLRDRNIEVRDNTSKYSINQNTLGVTISGAEIDTFDRPGDDTYVLTKPACDWPRESLSVRIQFEKGVPTAINGKAMSGPAILDSLNEQFGTYGVGRHVYTGDTSIGLKGRIVFECPAMDALLHAHRALEETVLTQHQNAFKPTVARKWVELVYQGFFFEPLKLNLETMLIASQETVTGEVTIETQGGVCHATKIDSPHILQRVGATYAQGADWTADEAVGFIKLYGQSSATAALVNPSR